MKLAFIGLGRMGSGMARNLLHAGHELAVFNRSREKSQVFEAEGARVARSLAEACQGAEAAVTMLSDDRAVEEVVFGEGGLASALESGATHISGSTISTALVRRLASEHAARGQGFLSAPVFGRPDAAAQGKLLVVAAGAPELVERYRPVFDAIGRQTFVAGLEPWQANALKLCGNFMIASMLEAFGEGYATLRKAGVNVQVFLDAMNALFASPVYANYGRLIAEGRFEPAGFALALGQKDMRLLLETAQECVSPMPLASLLRDRMLEGLAQGQAHMDWSSVARVAARGAGL
jgi:3-hydroxyisobutyrate dehydrogenase-like beta-hydroxyacid dehydrogenase